MSQKLINLNPDLKRLRDDGYFVQIVGGFLVMRDVPYVNAQRQVKRANFISSLTLAGDLTRKPDTHVAYFDGEYPCLADGSRIHQISHSSGNLVLGNGVSAKHSFSSKPSAGYSDYYHKMTTYAALVSGPATQVEPDASARVFRVPEEEEDSSFHYTETASDRVGIGALTQRLESEKIAIVGVGGTGSYVLDFLAKTPVREIRIIDGDEFLQHNAFRAPGAPTLEALREAPKKVDYLKSIYERMHRGIMAHSVPLTDHNMDILEGITFAFLAMDAGDAKLRIVERLEAMDISFIDVGMGLELVDGSLGGIVRTTASAPGKRDHFRSRVSFAGGGEANVYSSNIQVADLNALNAVMAIIKWKKMRGFYRDLEGELHSSYTTDGNILTNQETT